MTRLQVGARVDRFTLVELLGQGGFGVVWRAVDEDGRPAALKFLLRPAEGGYDRLDRTHRFEREAAILLSLSHPFIPRALGCNFTEEPVYVAQEYVRGVTLEAELCKRRQSGQRFTFDGTVALIGKVARALHYAHLMGVVHRDVKPSNIMLVEGKLASIKVLDFGISKLTSHDASGQTTQGRALGTIAAMSPEQIQGDPDVDARADVFALGVLLFEIFTLRRCWARDARGMPLAYDASYSLGANEPIHILQRICARNPRPRAANLRASNFGDDVTVRQIRQVDAILDRALRVDRCERYASTLELALALEGTELLTPPPLPRGATRTPTPEPARAGTVNVDELRALAALRNVELPEDTPGAIKAYCELIAEDDASLPVGRPKRRDTEPAPEG